MQVISALIGREDHVEINLIARSRFLTPVHHRNVFDVVNMNTPAKVPFIIPGWSRGAI